MKTSMKQILTQLGIISVLGLALVGQVSADGTKDCVTTGQYGTATDCEVTETPREEITHETVETGVVENVVLAIGLFVAGYLVLLLAKKYDILK